MWNFFSAIFVCYYNCQRWPIWFLNIATLLIGKACVEWLLREPFCAACESSLQCILATGNGERDRNWQTASGQIHRAHLELIFKRHIFIWCKSVQLHRLCLVGYFPKALCQWRQKVFMSEVVSVSQCPAFNPWSCVLQDGWRWFWVLSIYSSFLHQWETGTLLRDFICLLGQNQGNSFLGNMALLGSLPVTHLKLLIWGLLSSGSRFTAFVSLEKSPTLSSRFTTSFPSCKNNPGWDGELHPLPFPWTSADVVMDGVTHLCGGVMEFDGRRNLVYSAIHQCCDCCLTTGKISSFYSTNSETQDLSPSSAWMSFQLSACPCSADGSSHPGMASK